MRVDQYIGVFIFTVKHDLMILGGRGWVGSAAITKKSTYCYIFKSVQDTCVKMVSTSLL